MLATQVHLSSQFTRHFVETLDRIRDAVHLFEMFTYDPINGYSGKCELQTISVSIPRRVPDKKKTLTLAAATKASFHEHLANVAFAHPFKSGVGVGELKVARGVGASPCPAAFEAASLSVSGAEKHRWVKSDGKPECTKTNGKTYTNQQSTRRWVPSYRPLRQGYSPD